jgi:thiamine biosynthesis lipoprotein
MAVTVVGADLALADGYATAAVVLGEQGMAWLATVPGVEAMGITDQRSVLVTEGFARYRRG